MGFNSDVILPPFLRWGVFLHYKHFKSGIFFNTLSLSAISTEQCYSLFKIHLFQVCNFSSYYKKTVFKETLSNFKVYGRSCPIEKFCFLTHKQIRNGYHFCAICKASCLGRFVVNMNVGLNFPFKKEKPLIMNGSWFR